ncbi:MAG: hypothetical protein WBG86_08985 [Polyangiales bacterium]
MVVVACGDSGGDPITGGTGGQGTGGTAGTGATGGLDAAGGAGGIAGSNGDETAKTATFLLGCTVATIHAPANVTVTIDPGPIEAGQPMLVEFTDSVFIGEAFLQNAEELLGVDLQQFVITPEDGSRATFTAVSGAEGDDVVASIPSLIVDFDEDTDGNNVPGPFEIAIPTLSAPFTAGQSGEQACFNFADGRTDTQIKGTVLGADDFELPLTINCRPADQDGLVQQPVILTPDATAGQICFDIP